MSKEMYIASSPHETKVAVLEDDQLVEVYFERDTDVGLVGGIYKGRVSRVLPGMQSAFVDIGLERDAFLYVSDFFYEDQEEYDKVFEEAEARATKFSEKEASGTAPAQTAPSAPVSADPTPVAAPAESAVTPAVPAAAPVAAPPSAESAQTSQTSAASGAPPSKDSQERRPFESRESRESRDSRDPRRGRRRRHRGRPEFGGRRDERDRSFSPAPPTQQDEPAGPPRAFEILPGESLAKYRDAAPVSNQEDALPDDADQTADGILVAGADVEIQEKLAKEDDDSSAINNPEVQAFETAEHEGAAPKTSEAHSSVVADEAPEPPHAASASVTEATVAFAPSAMKSILEHEPAAHSEPAPTSAPSPVSAETAHPTVESEKEFAAASATTGATSEAAKAPEESPSEAAEDPSVRSVEQSSAPAAVEEESETDEESSDESEEFVEIEEEIVVEGVLSADAEIPGEAGSELTSEGQPGEEGTAGADPAASGVAGAPGDRSYTLREPNQRPRFAPGRRRRGRRGPGGPGGDRAPAGDRGGDRGGRRPDKPREAQRSGGNNHPVQISEVLKEGQEILVQIAKEPLGTKGARITSHVALPGRYLVFMPTIDHIGVSRKIGSEEERLRLRNMILEHKGSLTGGFIVRTAGQGRSEEEFKADLKFLSTLWNEIRSRSERMKAPALIHRDLDLVQRLLRDLLTPDFKCVRVDNELDYERVLDFVNRCQPALVGKVKLYSRDTPMYEEFGVQQEIEKALKPKVWLKSGGYIVINQTEALVAIDVNTGKYVGKTNRLEDTIVKTNIDAVNEIVRQVRLRDLGGIIVIDFIDMDERKNRAKVVQALEDALRSDRAPTKVVSFHDFGLVAVTRKRVKQSLERTLCVPCNYCTGAGWIKSVGTVCNEILAEVKKMAKGIDGNVLTLRVNPEVAKFLKSREGGLLSELEALVKKDVIIKGDPSVHQERFEIY